MKNAKRFKSFSKSAIFILAVTLFSANVGATVSASAETPEAAEPAARYCDDNDVYLGDDISYFDEETGFGGEGQQVSASYDVYYDYKVIVEDVHLPSVPSFGNTDSSLTNVCAPVAGTNVVGYYDRWYENLIPNYTPGMVSAGTYTYFPDMSRAETKNTISSLYSLMGTNVGGGGTTEAGFKSGMATYVSNAGYSFSYSSFYSGATSVNLTALKNAVNQNKVGVVFCATYNFVYGISHIEGENRTRVSKITSTVGHMMMVYGYQTIAYYQNGSNFRTDTFLYACSGFGNSKTGYMELDNSVSLQNALIMTITA